MNLHTPQAKFRERKVQLAYIKCLSNISFSRIYEYVNVFHFQFNGWTSSFCAKLGQGDTSLAGHRQANVKIRISGTSEFIFSFQGTLSKGAN